jgi:hypothetical protein
MGKHLYPLLLAFLLLSWGCESNNSFRTEAGVRSNLKGTWQWVPIPRNQAPQIWSFNAGKLSITYYDPQNPSQVQGVEEGSYKVETSITTPYIFISGTPFEGKWLVITLNNKVLTMNKTAQGTNALTQREFIKK